MDPRQEVDDCMDRCSACGHEWAKKSKKLMPQAPSSIRDDRLEQRPVQAGRVMIHSNQVFIERVGGMSAGGVFPLVNGVPFYGRRGRFTDTFIAGMLRDTTLDATTRNQYLKETEEDRKRMMSTERMGRLEDFHVRMITEIGILKKREERVALRKKRRELKRLEAFEAQVGSGIIKAQALFRGHCDRRRLQERIKHLDIAKDGCFFLTSSLVDLSENRFSRYHATATLIEKTFRGFLGRKRVKAYLEATKQLQRFFRAMLRKKRIAEKEAYDAMVHIKLRKIQALFRGFYVRQLLNDDEQSHSFAEKNSAKKSEEKSKPKPNSYKKSRVGASTSSSSSSSRYGATKAHPPGLNAARENKRARNRAALSLQKTYRGFKTRSGRHVNKTRAPNRKQEVEPTDEQELRDQEKASRSIQLHYRKHKQQVKEKQELERASRSIQKSFRAHQRRSLAIASKHAGQNLPAPAVTSNSTPIKEKEPRRAKTTIDTSSRSHAAAVKKKKQVSPQATSSPKPQPRPPVITNLKQSSGSTESDDEIYSDDDEFE